MGVAGATDGCHDWAAHQAHRHITRHARLVMCR
jgi:hypothetical protein